MTVYVYARHKQAAEAWARQQGYRPREFEAYGDYSMWGAVGLGYQAGDRVVILGDISHRARAVVERQHLTSPAGRPDIERLPSPAAVRS